MATPPDALLRKVDDKVLDAYEKIDHILDQTKKEIDWLIHEDEYLYSK